MARTYRKYVSRRRARNFSAIKKYAARKARRAAKMAESAAEIEAAIKAATAGLSQDLAAKKMVYFGYKRG